MRCSAIKDRRVRDSRDGRRAVRILLVDDEPDMLFLLGAALDDDRWQVVGKAVNGEDALRLAAQVEPDIAVIDYMMPGLNGFLVAERLRAVRPTCYNLIFSAYANVRHEAESHAGVDGFHEKDQFARLGDVIEEIGRSRGLLP